MRTLKECLTTLDGKVETAVKKVDMNIGMDKEMGEKVEASRKEIGEVNDNLSKVNKDVDEVKVMMTHVLEKLNMLEQLNKLSSPADVMLNTPRQDILVAGGDSTRKGSRSTEIYSWEKNVWLRVSPMN